jgi:hypothetical protein
MYRKRYDTENALEHTTSGTNKTMAREPTEALPTTKIEE